MPKTQRDQPTTKRNAKSRIPVFHHIEEEAQFWDTHSTTEFEDEFEPAPDVRFMVTRGEPTRAITVRLPETALAVVTSEAQAAGVRPSALVRAWILEHLRHSEVRRP